MARIPPEKIDEIKQSAEIVTHISRYVALKKSGKNFLGLCPFHKEKTPSFSVSPEKQIFYCFGCGKGGDVFGFTMAVENISYIEAVRKTAFNLGIKLPEYSSQISEQQKSEFEVLYKTNQEAKNYFVTKYLDKNSPAARQYFSNRKIKTVTSKKFEIGFAPKKWDELQKYSALKNVDQIILEELGLIQKKSNSDEYFDKFRNRIMFPFHNTSGRIVGFGGRRLDENDQPKYLNSPESRVYKKGEILYGLYQAIDSIREKKSAILVEGYFDLLRLVDSGIPNVVASSGTALTEGQARLLKRYTDNVIISYDSDDAGIKAAMRNSDILEKSGLNVYIIEIPLPYDPDSLILENGKNAFFNLLKNKFSPMEFKLTRFLANKPDLSIESKNTFIDQSLESLVSLPNEVKVGLYIHQISQRLEIAENFLISRFNSIKKRNQFRKEIQSDEKNEQTTQSRFRTGQWRAEEGLLTLLLSNNAEVINYILSEISASNFKNDDLKKIFEKILITWEEMGEINLKVIQQEFDNAEEQNLLAKLSMAEINNPDKFAADCVYQMRKWHLDSRFSELKRLMNQESTAQKSVLHYMKELAEIRKKLSDIETERARFLKMG